MPTDTVWGYGLTTQDVAASASSTPLLTYRGVQNVVGDPGKLVGLEFVTPGTGETARSQIVAAQRFVALNNAPPPPGSNGTRCARDG